MTRADGLEKLRQLTDEVKFYEENYRIGTPKISDYEYDLKFKELQAFEENMGYAYTDSPTLNVGSDLQKEFKKAKHQIPMQSIENVYSNEELVEWIKDIQNELGSIDTVFSVEPKYDGLAVSLIYKKGRLVQGITRGNQVEGDDVTANVYQISNIPKVLKSPIDIDIRGEVLMSREVFEELNKKREANGEKLFVNPRNACSGSLKQLDPKVTKERNLMFASYAAYPIGEISESFAEGGFDSQEETISTLIRLGFYTYDEVFVGNSIEQIVNFVNEFEQIKNAKKIPYDCDGVVIKVNSRKQQEQLGLGTTAPKWVKARKYKPENQSTEIKSVEFSVGTFGAITPVLNLEPIFISGTTVARATANNEDFIKGLDLHYGDKVFVEKSGEIIPKVIGLDEEYKNILLAENRRGNPIEFPSVCPCCGKPLTKEGAIWKCTNFNCPEQQAGRLVQFCSKNAMNIEGVGPQVAKDVVKHFNICKSIEIMTLPEKYTAEEMVEILPEGYGIKLASKLLDEIIKAKERPFECVLFALCIDSVGRNTAKLLANQFKSAENMLDASIQDFVDIDGIGEITAKKIYEGIHFEDLLQTCIDLGLKTSIEEKELTNDSSYSQIPELVGKNVLFTGTSAYFNREETEQFYKTIGCNYSSGVNKKLDCLIIGVKPGGSKVKKAESLGIPIISEEEFLRTFNIHIA